MITSVNTGRAFRLALVATAIVGCSAAPEGGGDEKPTAISEDAGAAGGKANGVDANESAGRGGAADAASGGMSGRAENFGGSAGDGGPTGGSASEGRPTGGTGGTSMAGCGRQLIPLQGLVVWLSASHGIETNANGQVVKWTDEATNIAATLQTRSAASHEGEARSPAPTAPRLAPAAANGKPAVRFDGVRDELTLVDPPSLLGKTALTIAEVAATTKLVKPSSEWCQQSFRDPIIENGCSGTYRSTFFWGFPGGPGYSAISLSLMQESVSVQYGTGARDQKFFWIRPRPIGSALARAIAMHEGTSNRLWVDGALVATTTAQDGKTAVVNGGKRLDLGVGRFDLHWPGDLAELMIYDRGLSETERATVEAYLACSYFP